MKQKTNKAASKRFSISARGRAKRRPVHQSHFNAKDSGKETRRKHAPQSVDPTDQPHLRRLLPYA